MPTNPIRKNYTMGMKDFYRDYKWEKYGQGMEFKEIIPYKTYKAVLVDFFQLLCKKIIEEQFVFVLPNKLGSIFIKSRRRTPENAPIDWVQTKKHKKLIRFLNLHTFGYFFFTVWERSHVRLRNKVYYNFRFVISEASKKKGAGRKAIGEHILKTAKNPLKRSYLKF